MGRRNGIRVDFPPLVLDASTDYEKLRQANIASNESVLKELLDAKMEVSGSMAAAINVLGINPPPQPQKRKKATAKPKAAAKKASDEDGENVPPGERPMVG